MSQENVELVRAFIPTPDTDIAALLRDESLLEATKETLTPLLHPELESVGAWQGGTVYIGVDGFINMWSDWLEPWATYHVGTDGFLDAGDQVVALARDRGRPHDVEAEVELVSASVWTVREAKIVRVEFFGNRTDGLEAVGLSEQDAHAES